jgi:cell division protein FtsL
MSTIHRSVSRPSARPLSRPWSLRKVLFWGFIAAALVGLWQVIQISDATSMGFNMSRIERERLDWQASVHELEAEVAALTSLDRIEREARERLGMVPAQERIYVEVDTPVPQQQLIPRRFLDEETESTEPSDSWWDSLLRFLPFF